MKEVKLLDRVQAVILRSTHLILATIQELDLKSELTVTTIATFHCSATFLYV
jgi:hypothetical protein